jgi:hypothetical protein
MSNNDRYDPIHLPRYEYRIPGESLQVPAAGVFDPPYRYHKINKAWSPIIMGIVSILTDDSRWTGSEADRARAVSEIAKFIEGADVNFTISQDGCDIVLLEGGAEISRFTLDDAQCNLLNPQRVTIVNNEIQIDNDGDGVADEVYQPPTDGLNTLPPPPPAETASACGSAYNAIAELRSFIASREAELAIDPPETVWIELLSIGGIVAAIMRDTLFQQAGQPSLLSQFDTNAAAMREYLYCNNFSKDNFAAWLRSEGLDAIADYADSIAIFAWDEWITVGSYDTSQDCSAFCPQICYLYDFVQSDGGWTIRQEGNWGGTYIAGVGFQTTLNQTGEGNVLYVRLTPQPTEPLAFMQWSFTTSGTGYIRGQAFYDTGGGYVKWFDSVLPSNRGGNLPSPVSGVQEVLLQLFAETTMDITLTGMQLCSEAQ